MPPEELDKFVEKVVAVKEGRTPGQYAMIHYSILWEEGKMPGQYAMVWKGESPPCEPIILMVSILKW